MAAPPILTYRLYEDGIPVFTGLSSSLTSIAHATQVAKHLVPLLDLDLINPEGQSTTTVKDFVERRFNLHEATSDDLNERVFFMAMHLGPPAVFLRNPELFWELCWYAMEGLGLTSPDGLLVHNRGDGDGGGGSTSGGVSLRDWIPTIGHGHHVHHLCQLETNQKVFSPFFLGQAVAPNPLPFQASGQVRLYYYVTIVIFGMIILASAHVMMGDVMVVGR